MSKKTINILSGIFVLLLAVFIWPTLSEFIGERLGSNKGQSLVSVGADVVNKVVITQGVETVTLEKKDTVWRVGEYEVDGEKITSLLTGLADIETKQIVSRNKENHSQYMVDETGGLTVTISHDGNDTTIIVGKSGSAAGTYYIRKKDSDDVYLAEGALRNEITATDRVWIDKTLVKAEKDKIVKVEVTGAQTFTLEKKDSTWKRNEKGSETELTSDQADPILASLSSLSGYDIGTDDEKKTFDSAKQKITVRVFTEGTDTPQEFTAVKIEQDYLAKRTDRTAIVKISATSVDSLL
ncbi:DUF4340 domain-containing protein [Candidatus Roizmanbacteria bacterium]|nr:DUF4340 domain-containing protein [Candidatus Roizmanbacteria bacterium]